MYAYRSKIMQFNAIPRNLCLTYQSLYLLNEGGQENTIFVKLYASYIILLLSQFLEFEKLDNTLMGLHYSCLRAFSCWLIHVSILLLTDLLAATWFESYVISMIRPQLYLSTLLLLRTLVRSWPSSETGLFYFRYHLADDTTIARGLILLSGGVGSLYINLVFIHLRQFTSA